MSETHDNDLAVPVEGWPAESAQRLEKLKRLREQGLNPYPTKFERAAPLAAIVEQYGGKTGEELEAERPDTRVAGRVLLKREMGKASFATLGDGTCLSRYDGYLYSHTTAALSYHSTPVLVEVSLMHKGSLAVGAAPAHTESVMRGLQDIVGQFATRIRDANK